MKILQVCHRFYPVVGGTEEAVLQNSKWFVKWGYDVLVVTSHEPNTKFDENVEGIRVKRVPIIKIGTKRFPMLSFYRKLFEEHYDIVMIHGQAVWCSDYLFPFMKFFNTPIIFTAHGFYLLEMRNNLIDKLYYNLWLSSQCRRFDWIVARTEHEKNILVSWGVNKDRISIIHHGFVPERYENRKKDFREKFNIHNKYILLYVGGFFDNKRVDRLIESCAKVNEDYMLVIVGKDVPHSKYNQSYCEALAKKFNINVLFTGLLPEDELLSAYGSADIFLLGSQFEGFGAVLLEAMYFRIPFISFNTGAAYELARKGGGYCVDTVNEMSEKINYLLKNEDERRKIGERGKIVAKDYTWERAGKMHIEVFRKVQSKMA